jgi:HD-GYP domain-containing protein (c-di-GMP phosphodiesterase class II)
MEANMKINKRQIEPKYLDENMILAETIHDVDGKVLFSEGLKLNKKRISRILLLDKDVIFIEDRTYDEVTIQPEVKESVSIFEERATLRKSVILNETRNDASKIVCELLDEVLDGHSLKADKIRKIVERIINVILMDDRVVLNLSNLNAIDDYLLSHSVNVCVLSLVTGIYSGLTQNKLMQLGVGALIHDIGKMLIPQEIYHKPGKLSENEFIEMQNHTLYGYKILKETLKFEKDTAEIALLHHERMDGLGYPNQLSENKIPIFAKIVGVTDVFDALTSDRIYCEKISYYKGIEYLIEHAGTQFDEDTVKKFITMVGYYPIGLYVKLNTGDVGQIMTKNKLCPIVRVTTDANGDKVQEYYEIDLYKNTRIYIIDIDIKEFKLRRASQ